MTRLLALFACSVALVFATASTASATSCESSYTGSQNPWTWRYTGLWYTDWSEGAANAAFDLSRFDSGYYSTWSAHDGSVPYYIYFDNGSFSPQRRTGLYTNATGTANNIETGNDNGSCT